jgi:hypothetical protein
VACDSEYLFAIGEGVTKVFAMDPATGVELWSWPYLGVPIMTIAEDYIWIWGWSGANRVLRKIIP